MSRTQHLVGSNCTLGSSVFSTRALGVIYMYLPLYDVHILCINIHMNADVHVHTYIHVYMSTVRPLYSRQLLGQ